MKCLPASNLPRQVSSGPRVEFTCQFNTPSVRVTSWAPKAPANGVGATRVRQPFSEWYYPMVVTSLASPTKMSAVIFLMIFLPSCKGPVSTREIGAVSPSNVSTTPEATEARWIDCKKVAWAISSEVLKTSGHPMPGRPNLYAPNFPNGFDGMDEQLKSYDAVCWTVYQQELAGTSANSKTSP